MALKPYAEKRRGLMMTSKQHAVLKALVKGNPDGSLLDVHQLIEATAPGTTRGAMICTLRHLVAHGLVREDGLVLRRSRKVRTLAATDAGRDLVRPTALPSASSGNIGTP
ncbi:hypothetical protein SAMN03159338_1613 [Sphingomonas sp. NFR04]|jgi:hypothetical protein|uniref:hypothetical protein n=1 Tax=Sphingomonas sp. NFR04 TaxID=1566283 RepID=UPI0008F44853|nr:hypothetical protein [Sphingomonas sp. NFR04]SFJ51076.1 hypothetical protein SAMN03159338_1613 [Sphingomonas sp. NFR04]